MVVKHEAGLTNTNYRD
uniref:Uncharacterized protein n=1 Tax=Arundo donax TaxID=35708 RepID=A0A0A8ZP02_ARUDO